MYREGTFRRKSSAEATIHDMVNQAIAQVTSTTVAPIEENIWDFLQHNLLIDTYASAPFQQYFTHLKLETYDDSTYRIQHMQRFTSSMYVYNASNVACYRLFPSSLTGSTLAWYAHLPS